MTVELYHGDCLEVLPTLASDSIDLVLTDPPYNGVKDEAWDNQWASSNDYLEWLDGALVEFERVLRFNGSLYLFASPQMAAQVEDLVSWRFNVLNSIVWHKDAGRAGWSKQAHKEALRSYFPQTERIIFAEHCNSDNAAKGEAGYARKCDELRGFVFEPLRAYLDGERQRAGLTTEQCNLICGHREQGGMAGRHYFSTSQWCLPTEANYLKLREGFHRLNHGGEYLRREYEDLRREYEDLRREYEDLRRPFNVSAAVPYTDVWDFATVQSYPGKHPCEKPAALLEHIISASSRPGAVVLDACMGSGATGKAAVKLGRDFIGIDASEHWVDYARRNIEAPQQMEIAL